MKKRHYPVGYKMVLFFALPYFLLGQASFAAASSTSEDKTKEMSDRVFETLVKETQETQERQEAVSSILNEKKVVAVVVKKDDGSVCQVSKEESPESYVPSFMNVGDSFKDFGLSACGSEELATLRASAQVAAIEDGPSQAKVAAIVPVLTGIGAVVGCGYGFYRSAFIRTEKTEDEIGAEVLQEIIYGGLTVVGTRMITVGLEVAKVTAASSGGPYAALVAVPIGTYIICKTGGTFLHYITD